MQGLPMNMLSKSALKSEQSRRAAARHAACAAACAMALAAAQAGAVDLVGVYERALRSDPVLAGAEAANAQAQEAVVRARSVLLPRVDARAGESRSTVSVDGIDAQSGLPYPERELTQRDWGVSLSQPLLNVPVWFNYLGAKASARRSDWELRSAAQQLVIRVATAYLNVLRGQAALESAVAAEEAVGRQLEQVQQRFDVGLVAITDVLDAKAEFDNAVVGRIQAEGDHAIFFEGLRTLTGAPFDAIDRIADSLPIVDPEPADEEAWVAAAQENSHAIRAAREGLTAAQRDVEARLAGHLPTISASVSYGADSGSQAFGGFVIPAQSSERVSYRLGISAPIFSGFGTRATVRQARFGAARARAQLIERELGVAERTRNLYRTVVTDVVRVKARAEAIKSAEAALEATQTGYEVGTRNIVEVLLAQRRLFESQRSYANSRYEYVLNLLRLKEAAGALDARDIAELNGFMDGANPVRRVAAAAGR